MTVRLLEAVPNFSEGRDLAVVEAIVASMRRAGADVLDWSADPDHHRCVVTIVGSPQIVESASVAGARTAVERIDLRRHCGVHPRVGALDVLPFVPVAGLTLEEAVASAWRVGRRLADEVRVPVLYYGEASRPPGRSLRELRRGGYERLVERWPDDRRADELPSGWSAAGAHPSAGVSCVGARGPLLAWNVNVEGITVEQARTIAAGIRERGDANRGVRALALPLESRGVVQISMNLEAPGVTSPMAVFEAIEQAVVSAGGRITETEIIGLAPDALFTTAAADRLALGPDAARRLLSARLLEHVTNAAAQQSAGTGR